MFTTLLNTMAVPMGFVEMYGQGKYCSCHLNNNNNRDILPQTENVASPASPQGSSSSLPLPDLIMSHNPSTAGAAHQSRTFVFPPSIGSLLSSSQTSTASQTTPSLTRSPVFTQFSSTMIESPIIRPSATIFSLPSTPSTSSPAPENVSSHGTSENSSRLTQLHAVESDSTAEIGPLDYSASALKRRRSKAFGYSPPFESNIVLDTAEENPPQTESTITTASSSNSEVSSIGPSALIIANIVLPRDSNLADETNPAINASQNFNNGENSDSSSELRGRPENNNEFVVNHCIPMPSSPFTLDECRALERAKNNLKHIVAVQERLTDDPYYDWPTPVGLTKEQRDMDTSKAGSVPACSADPRVYYFHRDELRIGERRGAFKKREVPHRRLLNDRNDLRMSWELPPPPPPPLPAQVPYQPVVPVEFGSRHPASDDALRDRDSKFLMKCVGEDLRNIADQFEISRAEVAPRQTLQTIVSEALLENAVPRTTAGKFLLTSVVVFFCWKVCSKVLASSSR